MYRMLPYVMLALILGGCAHSAPEPVYRDPIVQQEELGKYRHLLITSQANPGVFVPDHDRENVVTGVKRELHARSPNRFVFVDEKTERRPSVPAEAVADKPETLHMHIVFTEYDEGSAFGRFMLAGVGQIRLGTRVLISDFWTDKALGEYDVSKQFAFGGIYGATTDMQDVEQGLVKGIAGVLVPETRQRQSPKAYPD